MTTSVPLSDAPDAFADLAQLVYRGETYPRIYDEICRAAVDVVPGCSRACITTISAGEEPVLQASTDEIAALVDGLEWETHQGPCVDAIMSQRFDWDPDITTNPTWPRLAARLLKETPVRGMIGYRITVNERKVGALNLFADTPGALTPEGADMGAILASFASVALTAATQREEAVGLRQGMLSNREIGKALGILMVTHGLSNHEAFQRLREASNHLNTRVIDIARHILEEYGPSSTDSA